MSGKTEKDGVLLVKTNLLHIEELRAVLTFVSHNSTVLALKLTLSYKGQIDPSGNSFLVGNFVIVSCALSPWVLRQQSWREAS